MTPSDVQHEPPSPDHTQEPGTATGTATDEAAQLRRELDDTRRQLHSQQRRAAIERELAAAGAIDPASTTPLVERSLPAAEASEAKVRDAVARLGAIRPALFRGAEPRPARAATPMSGVEPQAPRTLRDLAGRAGQGDRGSVLEYLRARRAK